MIKNEKVGTYLGSDIGTSHTAFACMNEDGIQPLMPEKFNSQHIYAIPSTFWQPPAGEPKMGFDATDGERNDIQGFVKSIKMKLKEKEIKLHDKIYTPKEILTAIIKYSLGISKEAMEEHNIDAPKNKDIVVGIPIDFGLFERHMITDIFKDLGYNVQFLPEPMAAAVYCAYAEEKKKPGSFDKVLVFDMGAGTFDAAFLQKNPFISDDEPYPYICPKHGFQGNCLAGDLIDEKLAEYMLKKLSPAPTAELLKKIKDKNQFVSDQLAGAARYLKEQLSISTNTQHIFSLEKQLFSVEMSRNELEQVAAPIVNEAVKICKKIVNACGMENEDFEIVMVGGMSNLQMVKDSLAKAFPKQAKSIKRKEPTRAIAFGCAVYSQAPKLSRRVTYGYAIESFKDNRSVLAVEIPSDVRLPFTVDSRYETRVDNQSAMEFRIYEVPNARKGEYLEISDGEYHNCKVIHKFATPVPKGTRVECRITLNESGTLTIAIDDGNNIVEPKKFFLGIGKVDDFYVSKSENDVGEE